MAFKLARKETYETEIAVSMPGDKGKRTTEKFLARFKHVELTRLDELRSVPHREVLDEVLVGWSGMVDENDEPVPFNNETRAAVYEIPQAFEALVQGFWTSIFGAKKGN